MKIHRYFFLTALLLLLVSGIKAQDFASFMQAGELARQRGEFQKAIENFENAKESAVKSSNKSQQAQVSNLIGQVFYTVAKYNPAIRSFREAEKLANSVGDKREEARAWAFLGQLYWRVTKKEDGERLLKDALAVFEKTNDEINIALTLRFLGRLENGKPGVPISAHGVNTNFKPAIDCYERSLAISRKIGDEEGELTTLKEIGLVYQGQEKLPHRLDIGMSYLEPLRVRLKNSNFLRLYAVVLNNIATNEYMQGRADSNGSGIADNFKFEKSMETADEAARIFREIGDRQELREMLDRKAFCLHYLGRYEEALSFIDESIKIADELYVQPIGDALDRSLYFESLIISYRQKMNALYKLKRPAEMFETQEAMKSLALRDLLNRRKDVQKYILTANQTAEEKRLNDEINALNRQILQIRQKESSANAKAAELNLRLQKARLAKEEWLGNIAAVNEKTNQPKRVQNLNISQMCALIPDENTAFVEYEASTHPGGVFVLMKTGAAFKPEVFVKDAANNSLLSEKITLPNEQTCSISFYYNKAFLDIEKYTEWHFKLMKRMPEFREQIARNSPSFKENAKFLYDALLSEGMPLLKDKKHLVIIPNGAISDVPFQALMNEAGRYLIEDFSISYAPSLSSLAEMQENRQKLSEQKYKGDFLAFGNPRLSNEIVAKLRSSYRDGRLDNLPEAEAEVNTIGKFYANGKILTRAKATEEVWREEAKNYRILHLATHGLSDGEKPLYSHVLLAADADDDGLIEAREIAEMNLAAEMVVLSACETARGREIDGEGMVGLAWSFAAAGTPTVVASNWKIDSAETADFMIDFYSQLNEKDEKSKAEALQKAAVRKLRNKRTSHPFYWAGFSIFGDWQNYSLTVTQ